MTSDDRFAHFVAIQKARIYTAIRKPTEQYVLKERKFYLTEDQWRQLIDQFGDHLTMSHRIYGAPDLLDLQGTARLKAVDKEFVMFVKGAARRMRPEPHTRSDLADEAQPQLPAAKPAAKPINVAIELGVDTKNDRDRRLVQDVEALLALGLGYSINDARALLKRRSPFIRARRAAEEAERLVDSGQVRSVALARKRLIASSKLKLSVIPDEAMRDDPLVRELTMVFTNVDAQTAALTVDKDREKAHDMVDKAKRRLGLDVTQPLDQEAVDQDLVWVVPDIDAGPVL